MLCFFCLLQNFVAVAYEKLLFHELLILSGSKVAVLASQLQEMTPKWDRLKCVNVMKYAHEAELKWSRYF